MVSFRSEAFSSIPLPPEVSFELAFSRLDADSNSFYLLELDDETYMQCGGGPSACSVEIRRASDDGVHRSYVVGRSSAAMANTAVHVGMSKGGVWVRESESLTVDDAVRLFNCFFKGQPLPATYELRDRALDPVKSPADERDADAMNDDRQQVQDTDESPAVRWLAADDPDNVFGIEGYDCAAYVDSRISTTTDPRIANSFLEGRTGVGAQHMGQLPEDAVSLECAMTYELTAPLEAGVVFRATEMEDKWDIFRHGHRILFCRSWTGQLALFAEVRQDGSSLAVYRVWATSKLAHDDPELPVRQVDYLIRSHVLGRTVPHPLPSDLPRRAQDVGDYSFAIFGRNCDFGSFEDTMARPVADAQDA